MAGRRNDDGPEDFRNDRYGDPDDRYEDEYDDRYDDRYDDGGYDDVDGSYSSNYRGRSERSDRESDNYGNRSTRYDDDYEDYGYEDDFEESERGHRDREKDYDYDDPDGSDKSRHKTRRIVLIIVEVAILAVVLGVLYVVSQVSKVEKVNLPTEEIENNISDEVKQNAETGEMKGYRNVAFFGVDSTQGQLEQNTRSDSIMICSINQDTGDVKLVSIYRDTLLNLGDGTYNKCNAAYAKGGAEQAINMLNTNLDMNITDFVTVGFGGLTDVVDALGGIPINVEEDEIQHLNNYQTTMARELNKDYTEVTEPGLQTLNGLQATAYCRIRYTNGWDYKRAARQRAVLYAIIDKAKQADAATLTQIVNDVADEIYTSYSVSDLISDVTALANYNVIEEDSIDTMSNGFPQESNRIQADLGSGLGDCVVPRSLTDNVRWLHQFLFDDEDYDVSDTVQEYSDHIDEMTKDAVDEPMTDADHT